MEKEVITRTVNGVITHVIVGYIAAQIPAEWQVRKAKIVGISTRHNNDGEEQSYYDVALDDRNVVHIWKQDRYIGARPYWLEEVRE